MAKKKKIDRDTKMALAAVAGLAILTTGVVVLVDRTERRIADGARELARAAADEIEAGINRPTAEVKQLAKTGYAAVAQLEAALYALAQDVEKSKPAQTAIGLADELKQMFLRIAAGGSP